MRACQTSRALLLGVLAALGAMAAPGASADPPELERRLRADDVPAGLRAKVRTAIERGIGFLAARQAADGSFSEHGGPRPEISPLTATLRAALALRHAGTPAAHGAYERAVPWLFDAGGETRLAQIEASVDDTSLALMLLLATPGRHDLARRLVTALCGALDPESGWWRHGSKPSVGDVPNLEASQLAVLGLLAARAMAIDVPAAVWRRHALALVTTQRRTSHAWPLRASPASAEGEGIGTLHGFGTLSALGPVLQTLPELPAGLAQNVADSAGRAQSVLGRDAGRILSSPLGVFSVLDEEDMLVLPPGAPPPFALRVGEAGRRVPLYPGEGAYARLFAVERACRLGEIQSVEAFPEGKPIGGKAKPKPTAVPCYATAAKWLVTNQRVDGGFAPEADDPKALPSETDTALALLVLTRAVSAYHPARPAPLDAQPRPPAAPLPAPK